MSHTVRREVPRPRGPGRAIFITLVVLLVLAVGADFGLRFLAERWLEGRVQQTLGLPSRPDLQIGGFPFLVEFAQGEFSQVDAELQNLQAEGLTLDRVTIGLRRVRFERGDVLTGGAGEISVRQGRGSVAVGETAFNRFLQDQGVPVTVRFLGPRVRAETRISVGGEEASASTVGRMRLEGNVLVFEPGDVSVEGTFGVPPAAFEFRVTLPELFPGIRYTGLEVREAVVEVSADLRDANLNLEG